MDQVFRNLVSNAIKFSPERGTIEIKAFFQQEEIAEPRSLSQPTTPNNVQRKKSQQSIIPRFLHVTSGNHFSGKDPENANHSVHQTLLPGQENTDICGNLIIVVTDSGPGISETNQKKLFRSVVQFDPEKNQGGGIITHPINLS